VRSGSTDAAGPPRVARSCSASERSRTAVTLADGSGIYVEPVAFSQSGAAILLAGSPNYLFQPDASGASALVARDSVFGVILSHGRWQAIPAPISAALVTAVRVASRDDGSWDAVFGERSGVMEPGRDDQVAGLWYGRLDESGWHDLQSIPLPRGRVRIEAASPLVRGTGGSLALAVPFDSASATAIAVFQRRAGAWEREDITVSAAAYLTLQQEDSLGLVLGVVHPDPALPADENSLFLYAQSRGWRSIGKLIGGAGAPVHQPTASSAARAVTWWTVQPAPGGFRYEARIMLDPFASSHASAAIIDSSVAQQVAAVVLGRSMPLWITDHVAQSGIRTLRFILVENDASTVVLEFANPFDGYFGAVSVSPNEILLAGPKRASAPTDPPVSTLLLRIAVKCAGTSGSSSDTPVRGPHFPPDGGE